jgi:hypothetical protein
VEQDFMNTYGKEVEEKQPYIQSGPLIKGLNGYDKDPLTPII